MGRAWILDKVDDHHNAGGSNTKLQLRLKRGAAQAVYEYITLAVPGATYMEVPLSSWLREQMALLPEHETLSEPFYAYRIKNPFSHLMQRVPFGFLVLLLGAWLVSPSLRFIPRCKAPAALLLCLLTWISIDGILTSRDMAAFKKAPEGSQVQASAMRNMTRTIFFQERVVKLVEQAFEQEE